MVSTKARLAFTPSTHRPDSASNMLESLVNHLFSGNIASGTTTTAEEYRDSAPKHTDEGRPPVSVTRLRLDRPGEFVFSVGPKKRSTSFAWTKIDLSGDERLKLSSRETTNMAERGHCDAKPVEAGIVRYC